jgi:hypothetical protein
MMTHSILAGARMGDFSKRRCSQANIWMSIIISCLIAVQATKILPVSFRLCSGDLPIAGIDMSALSEKEVSPCIAGEKLRLARNAISNGMYGEALGAMSTLPQLSQTPFASKIIAFLALGKAGVYDNKIARALRKHPVLQQYTNPGSIFENCLGGIGLVANPTIRKR